MSGLIDTGHFANIMHLAVSSGGSPNTPDLDTLTDAFQAAWKTAVQANLGGVYALQQIQSVWYTGVGTEIVSTRSYSWTGSRTSSIPAANVALVVNWHISSYYRGGHPRTYLGGVCTGDVTGSTHLNAGYVSAFAANLATFRSAVNALTAGDITSCELGTVSFQSANAWRTPPVFRPYTSVSIRSKLGAIHRRVN